MKIPEKLLDTLNKQVTAEHQAALIYTQLSYDLDHLSFTVDTPAALEDAVKTLDELGISHEGIKDAGPGLSIVEFRDPDNIALELSGPDK